MLLVSKFLIHLHRNFYTETINIIGSEVVK
jgi:hypothetical protein